MWLTCRCAEMRLKCDACTLRCAREMESYTGSHRCNVTADDVDDGRSPRLRYCLACCQNFNCSGVCAQVYASRDCRRIRLVSHSLQSLHSAANSFIFQHTRCLSCRFLLVRKSFHFDLKLMTQSNILTAQILFHRWTNPFRDAHFV